SQENPHHQTPTGCVTNTRTSRNSFGTRPFLAAVRKLAFDPCGDSRHPVALCHGRASVSGVWLRGCKSAAPELLCGRVTGSCVSASLGIVTSTEPATTTALGG